MRIGILNVAHGHAHSYVQKLLIRSDIEIIGVADEDSLRGKGFAAEYHLRTYRDYDDLLADKPDAVVICAENVRHAPLTLMAADADAHILCEKPLATTVEDAQIMIKACQSAGVNLMTAFPMRFSAPVIEARRALEAGDLGRIYACNTTNQGQLPDTPWFVDKALSGGGAVTDHTVHVADLLRWYFGCEVIEVFAEANRGLYPQHAVETAGLVMLTFENGVFATIDCSWSRPPYYPTWGGVTLEIVGERGVLAVDAFKQFITVHSSAAQRPVQHFWGSDVYQGLINDFIDSIHEQRTPSVTGHDGLKTVEIVSAAYQSLESGQPIALSHSPQ